MLFGILKLFFLLKMFSYKILPQICRNLRVFNNTSLSATVSCSNAIQTPQHKCYSAVCLQKTENVNKHVNFPNIFVRNYAKGKDKKKEKGKGKVVVNENQIAEVVNVETLKSQMEKAIVQLEEDFIKHLSLRSTTGSIESLSVNLDGKEHSLQELAQIVRKNPKTIVINFTTFPQAIPAALKALMKSGMNLNPQQDGTTLFIPIPKVTKEHREALSKNAKQLFTKCKDSVRDVQQKQIKQIKKKEKISEDLARTVEQQIVAIADTFIAQAEDLLNRKQTELLGKD